MSDGKRVPILKSFEDLGKAYSLDGPLVNPGVSSTQELLLSEGVFSTKICLEPRAGRRKVKVLYISFPRGVREGVFNLVWQMLHGTKFSVKDVYILFALLEKYKENTPLAQRVFNLLVISNSLNRTQVRSTSKRSGLDFTEWDLKYLSLRAISKTRPELQGLYKSFTDYFNSLKNFPKTRQDVNPNQISSEIRKRIQRPCPPPAYIGVGYKDKGTLPPPGSEYDPDEITPYGKPDRQSCWKSFLNNFKTFLSSMGLKPIDLN